MASQSTETQSYIDKKLSRRITEQRQLILGIIQQADRHLDADEIYHQARGLYAPPLSALAYPQR